MTSWTESAVTLIRPAYVVPVRPAGVVLEQFAVAIDGPVILSVMPAPEALKRYPGARLVDLPDHLLLPGFVNTHTHSPMTLLRGYADDLDLQTWLGEHIWPAEQKFVGPDFVTDGTRLAVAEMLRAGTTCFNDMYFYPREVAQVCRDAGIRASIGVPLIEHESFSTVNIDRYFREGEELHQRWKADPLLSFTFAPHAPYTVSNATLSRIRELSEKLEVPVHLHLLETAWEIKHSLNHHEKLPLARLSALGLLNSRLQAVHMTQLSEDDMKLLGETSVQVIHCPQSNLKLASGICPISALLSAGVNVALGTDGAASNNDLDLLAEAQTAALLAKGISGNAESVDAFTALEMMTINGARALGMNESLGSIEPGKQADLCAIDFNCPETQPLHNVVSQLIYAASSRQVTDVWVAGQRVLESRRLTTIDQGETIEKARMWRERLANFNPNQRSSGEVSA
jgi:5-methylthioadenosine/S-adenosylhomocysteine deaminase